LDEVNKTKASEIEKKEKYLRRMEEFQKTYVLYEKELEKKALYDYDDTILGLISALKKNPDLQAEMRESFQYVLADEHQDANGAQNEILKFFRGVELDAIDPPNIFVVGDDKQSIFRFQGAFLENFYNFEKDFRGAHKIDLTHNYRSHGNILGVAHHLIKGDGRKHTELSPNVSYEIKPIEVDEYMSFEDELSGTVDKIKKELARNNKDTIAVISRTNGALFELARYLEKEKIAYSLAGEKSLFETETFIRLSYLFGALTSPMEDEKFIPAMYFGYFKTNLHDILTLENYAKKTRTTLANIILKNEFTAIPLEDQKAFEALSGEIKELISDAKKLPLLKMLQKLGERMVDVADSEALDVLRELFEEADKLVLKKRNALLKDFVEYLSMLQRHNLSPIIQSKEKKERLELLSIHKSKGLEYDFVHVIDVTDKKFEKMGRKGDLLALPDTEDEREDEKTIEENRRLLYVAITRAKQHAVLSYSLKGGQDQAQTPSVLLDELLPELTKKEVVREKVKKISLFGVGEKAPLDIKKTLQDEFVKTSFSVTALNNFLSCPWKYFFRNLLHIPDVKEFSAMLGTACHEALRHFHQLVKKGKKVSASELKKIIKDVVYAQAFSKGDLSVALEKAEESVTAYVKSFKTFDENEKIYIEERISFPLKIETEKTDFEIVITGVLDFVVEEGGHSHVIDFKTKKRMTLNEIMGKTKNSTGDYFRQLQFYKLLWENAGKESVVDKASLSFLTPERGDVSMETFELGENDKSEIEKILRDTLREIYSFSFWNKKCEDKKCDYCQMADVFKEKTK
jgi:DNA helicase-2/ATP-dependent DNA helicase PcrA